MAKMFPSVMFAEAEVDESGDMMTSGMSAIGFLIFTLISLVLSGYILVNMIDACSQFRAGKQRPQDSRYGQTHGRSFNRQQLLSLNGPQSSPFTQEGLKFKVCFFTALFVICLCKFGSLYNFY